MTGRRPLLEQPIELTLKKKAVSTAQYQADPERKRGASRAQYQAELLVELGIEQSLKRRGQPLRHIIMHSPIERRLSFVLILPGNAVLG